MKSFSKLRSQTRAPNVQQINKLVQLIDSNQLSEALLLTQNILEKDPKHSFAWKALGIIQHKENNFANAVDAFEQAYHCNPQDYEALQNLGKLYFLQRDYAKAQHYFQLLISIDPYDQSALENLVECLCSSGSFKASLDFIRTSLQHRLDGLLPSTTRPINQHFDQAENEQLLWTTLAALAQAGVHAFPTSGTLLGLEREGKLLSFDKDFDVGLPFSEMELACACLKQLGWHEPSTHIRFINPRSFTHLQTGMVLDLCGFALEESSKNVVSGFWQEGLHWDQQRVTIYPSNFELKKKYVAAGMVWEVMHVDDFLTSLYGDWRTPDPDFDTVCCAHNLRSYTDMVQMYTLNRLRQTWSQNQFTKALKLAEQHLRYVPQDNLVLNIENVLRSHITHT
jgi:tetratricopeptide (TPR) repeat protein